MQEIKYKYFIDNKEVETREDYLNSTMSGDYFTYFDGSSVFSFSFGEIERLALKDAIEFNEAVKQYLENLPQTEKWVNGKIKKDLSYIKDKEETNKNSDIIHSVTDEIGNLFLLVDRLSFIQMEQQPKILNYDGFYGYIENRKFYPSKYNKSKHITINWISKELNNIFKKEVNGHLSDVLKGNSTRHKAREQGKYHTEKEKQNPMEHLDEVLERIGEKVYYGTKESEGKTDYSEIDWNFIEGLAKRMNKNKEKYEPFNYHKPMDVNLLKQSLLRHVIEILKGNYEDAEQEYGHLFAVALNSQMIYYQLKNNTNNLEVKK